MITEERIKELVEKATGTTEIGENSFIMELARTVAAESHKEGYQQAIDDAISGQLIIGIE